MTCGLVCDNTNNSSRMSNSECHLCSLGHVRAEHQGSLKIRINTGLEHMPLVQEGSVL